MPCNTTIPTLTGLGSLCCSALQGICSLNSIRSTTSDSKYLPAYTVRALLLAAMSREGVERLGGQDRISIQDFATAFPDERQWFARLAPSPTDTVKDFLSSMDYTGRPELWSMFACLLLTRSMWWNPDWFDYHVARLRRAMRSQSEHSILRVPGLCVQDVMQQTHSG